MTITKKSIATLILIIAAVTIITIFIFGIQTIDIYKEVFKRLGKFLGLFLTLYTVFIAIVIFMESKNPSKTVAWLMVLFIIPFLGFILYIFLGQNIRKKYKYKKKKYNDYKHLSNNVSTQKELLRESGIFKNKGSKVKSRLINLLLKNSDSPFTINNKVEILTDGVATFSAIIDELEQATHHIHLEYFIIRNDEIGNKIKDILIKKANAGIEVRLIYDSVGCWKIGKKYINEMKLAGIKVFAFSPTAIPVLSRELNYRNHRKIIVIDGKVGFLGGLNIGDEYLGHDPKLGYWRDTHMKIKGEGVYSLQNIFLKDWEFVSGEYVSSEIYYPKLKYYGEELLQLTSSGPDSDWKSIMQAYFTMISNAENRIWIETPYLVPGESITTALMAAALSGVDVRVIIPNKPDHLLVYWASRGNVEDLLRAGVKVYTYEKGFIHSKVLLVDGSAATVGSANLDIRSLEINFEVNSFIYDEDVINRLEDDFKNDLKHSNEILLEEFSKRSIFEKFKESLGVLFSPLL
ncbi:cardiolipin synthase [Sporosalibacterium faouarense]|uniref:cardiolipin synthase n=1 Tax=Sporosalibacterium faouarense TaxID=516123 RepID=UPI00141CE160|nr:cardiolipin synthase [Sporosalibacterium faouarense]MTI46426.1 cardiolipin synthase [Bacillota bacterium]